MTDGIATFDRIQAMVRPSSAPRRASGKGRVGVYSVSQTRSELQSTIDLSYLTASAIHTPLTRKNKMVCLLSGSRHVVA